MEFATTRSQKKKKAKSVGGEMYAQERGEDGEIKYVDTVSTTWEIKNDKVTMLKNDSIKINYLSSGKAMAALLAVAGAPTVNGAQLNMTDQCPAELAESSFGWSLVDTIMVIALFAVIWLSWTFGSWMGRNGARRHFLNLRDVGRERERARADELAKQLEDLRQAHELQERRLEDRVSGGKTVANKLSGFWRIPWESHWELKHHSESVMQRVVDEVMDHHEDCPLNAGGNLCGTKRKRYGTRMKIASFSDKPRFDVYHRVLDAPWGVQTPYRANVKVERP